MMTLTVLFHDNNNDMKAIIITMYDNMIMMKLIESDDNHVIIKSDVVHFVGQAPSWGDPGGGEKTSGGEIHQHWPIFS